MATVDFLKANCSYPTGNHDAVFDLTLTVADGEFLVLLGPSSSGKTTVLRMLSGLQQLDSGAVLIDGEDVTRMAPGKRKVAMVFQHPTGYPVKGAIGGPESGAERRLRQIATELDIADYLDPHAGGPAVPSHRRVAVGRTTTRPSRVHLLDEPLNTLDAAERSSARAKLAALQRRTGVTTLYATHDHAEAAALGHRIAVLKDGVLQQVDTPRNLYQQPVNTFVASLVGTPPMNLVPAQYSHGWAFVGSANVLELPISPATAAAITSRSVIVGFRPEHARLVPLGAGIYATVESVEDSGHTAYVHCDIGIGREHQPLVVRCDPHEAPRLGDAVAVMPELDGLHVFSAATGQRL